MTAARSAAESALSIQAFTSSEAGAWSNSYLISGRAEAVLFDVFMLRTEAAQLAEQIAASGKVLSTVIVSHAHPDHFMGLDAMTDRFPNARVVTSRSVAADLEADGPWMFSLLKGKLGSLGPTRLVMPQALTDTAITLEGSTLEVVEFGEAESKHTAALHVPALRALLSADLVYNGAHLYLHERHLESWLERLGELEAFVRGRVSTIHPGHGAPGGSNLIDQTRAYLCDFAEAVKSGDAQAVESRMLARYPQHHVRQFLVQFSIPAYFPPSAAP